MPSAALKAYARRIRDLRRAHPSVSEPALAPAFQQLIETLLPGLPLIPVLTVVPEFNNPGLGRPDIALKRPGQPARAFVELKAPAKPADPTRWRDAHDRRQFARLKELSDWATSNFADFHLFHRDSAFGSAAIVPAAALDPLSSDAAAERLIAKHDPGPFLDLLGLLARADAPAARDAAHLAELMAHSARLVRRIIEDRLAELHAAGDAAHALLQVRQEFREVLYAHPEAGGYANADFDTLFSAAFAQTLAFGLLLVREATGAPVGDDAWERMPAEHPLMKTTLRVLSMPEVVRDIGIGFEVMLDTVNSFAPELLATGADGRDPILYFYEDFLQTFDPAARERYGVYYTPVEVVRYMTGSLDRALRDRLGTAGLRDEQVHILDPATGTGTFLLGVAERVRAQVEAAHGPVEAAMALRSLAARMYGFELLIGPYAVAHYRLHHALRHPTGADPAGPAVVLPRLGIYLTDTLARPGAAAPAGPLGFVSAGIQDERRAANRIKSEQPILAIIGNPPYRRFKKGEVGTLVGNWMDELWDDLKAPVRLAGWGRELKSFPDFSIAFWRWAMWKLFEADNAPQRGVVVFITNRTFVAGRPFAGVRKMMRERFDRIEIIDLRGDHRRGERAGIDGDQGAFDIQVGTAITLAISDGSKNAGELASIIYNDSWNSGRTSRAAKFAWLAAAADAGDLAGGVPIDRGILEDFKPVPFEDMGYLPLRYCFKFLKSGVKTGNDPQLVAVAQVVLLEQVSDLVASGKTPACNPQLIRAYAYRPYDRRVIYYDTKLVSRDGPDFFAAWGNANVCLYAMPSATGAGPAVWCHALLPDYHAFRGSYGGYAFPLYDRRRGPEATNVSPVLVDALSDAYGTPVTPPQVFDAMLCLLSAASYTRRFAEDLEDVFPHVPFPADPSVFAAAAALGADIRGIETFAAPATPPPGFARLATPTGDAPLVTVDWRDGTLALCGGDAGTVTGIPRQVWDFAVSGYRVLPRWLEGRIGLPADLALVRELRDVAARIADLIELFARADTILDETLGRTLTLSELGFAVAEATDDGEPE